MRATRCVLALLLFAVPAAAQSAVDQVANGRALADAREPAAALREFQAVLRRDSTQYEANWRAAIAAVDIGKQTPDSAKAVRAIRSTRSRKHTPSALSPRTSWARTATSRSPPPSAARP
jgi:hypothetical protein